MKNCLKLGLLVFICVILFGGSQVNAQKLKVSAPANTICVKQKIQMKVKPSGKCGSIIWKSTNRKIAVVSKKGVVTGKKAGRVKIYAVSVSNPKEKAAYVIKVF